VIATMDLFDQRDEDGIVVLLSERRQAMEASVVHKLRD
jgi:hypothetical protein